MRAATPSSPSFTSSSSSSNRANETTGEGGEGGGGGDDDDDSGSRDVKAGTSSSAEVEAEVEFEVALYNGTNADDLTDPTRLGLLSAAHHRVNSPVCQLSKLRVRQLAQAAGLPNWNLAAAPCLRSRLAVRGRAGGGRGEGTPKPRGGGGKGG